MLDGTLNRICGSVRGAGCGLLDLVLPDACRGCEAWVRGELGGLCERCAGEIEFMTRIPSCPRCGRSMQPLSIREDECAGCRSEPFWNVAEVLRVGEYAGSLRAMIVRLKYGKQPRDSDYLGRLLAERIAAAEWFSQIDALVPVPMHVLRWLQRPCNHAHALAESCLRHLRSATGAKAGLRLRSAVVRRSRYSASQTRKATTHARFANVENCFGPRRRANLAGQTVCIVDNLMVSGATVTEVSKVLRRLGAKRIYAGVLARTPPPGEVLRRVPAFPEGTVAHSS